VSTVLLVSCDRLRSGQSCRAFLPVNLDDDAVDPLYLARDSAVNAGWDLGGPAGDTCPSTGHDEP
jgi:hypothetical protein